MAIIISSADKLLLLLLQTLRCNGEFSTCVRFTELAEAELLEELALVTC